MERYIEQLISDLLAAYRPQSMHLSPKLEGDGEHTTTLMNLTGIAPSVFPPLGKLSESQLGRLSKAMVTLAESYHYIINLPKRLPVEMVYQKLLNKWTDEIWYIAPGQCLYGLDFCSGDSIHCSMREWCDCIEIMSSPNYLG